MQNVPQMEDTVKMDDALTQRWVTGMQQHGYQPGSNPPPRPVPTRVAPLTRYATFRPDRTSVYVMYGEAELYPGCGYVFRGAGCDWTVTVSYKDTRLVLGQEVTP